MYLVVSEDNSFGQVRQIGQEDLNAVKRRLGNFFKVIDGVFYELKENGAWEKVVEYDYEPETPIS